MGDVVYTSPDEVEVVTGETSIGSVKILGTVKYTVPTYVNAFYEMVVRSNYSPADFPAVLGGGYTFGRGLTGGEVSASYDNSTGLYSIELGGTFRGVGGRISGTFRKDAQGNLIVEEYSAFGGMKLIFGDQGEVLGATFGNATMVEVGVFIDPDGLDLGIEAAFKYGLGYAGGVELAGSAKYDVVDLQDLRGKSVSEIIQILGGESAGFLTEMLKLGPSAVLYILGKETGGNVLEAAGVELCFSAGTMISIFGCIQAKLIEEIVLGDTVVSFDKNGDLVPGTVTRVFKKEAKIILDFFGTGVTPGHVYYRPDSNKTHKFETLIDILRDDGVIQKADGTDIRACTCVPVGDPLDAMIQAVITERQAEDQYLIRETKNLRLGSRVILDDGRDICIADAIKAGGGTVLENGLVATNDCPEGAPFHWTFSETLPNPEDYVLKRSGTTLEDIYKVAEWEDQAPRFPAPATLDGGLVQPASEGELALMPRNEPMDLANSFGGAPVPSLNRKQRKAIAAKQRTNRKKRVH